MNIQIRHETVNDLEEYVDDGVIKAELVICAVPATKVPEVFPGLPPAIGHTLGNIPYSSGCRVVINPDHPPFPPAGTARYTPRTTARCCWPIH